MKSKSLMVGVLTIGVAIGGSASAATQTFYGQGYSWEITSPFWEITSPLELSLIDNKLSINFNQNYVSQTYSYLTTEYSSLFSSVLKIEDGYYLQDFNASIFGSYEMTAQTQYSDGQAARPGTGFLVGLMTKLHWNYLYYDPWTDEYTPDRAGNWYEIRFFKAISPGVAFEAGSLDESANYETMSYGSSEYSLDAELSVLASDSPSYTYVCAYGSCFREYAFAETKLYLSHASWDINVVAVPEPTSYAMLGLGLSVLGFSVRRKQSK